MKRRTILGGMLAIGTASVAVAAIAFAAGPSKANPQDGAERFLKSPVARYLTPAARSAVERVARGDRSLTAAAERIDAANAAGAGAAAPAQAQPAAAPRVFGNVRVNNPAADTQTDQTTQSEATLAVSGRSVVAGFNDSQHTLLSLTAATNLSGYAFSGDGGATWTDGGVIPNRPGFMNVGDPWLTTDRAGSFYYSTLALDGRFNLQIGVAKSTDSGRTFAAPMIASSPPAGGVFYVGDKEAMASGPDPAAKAHDNLYVAWDDFSVDASFNLTLGLPVARSTDGGATWQITYADKNVFDFASTTFTQYFGAQPIVDPADGTLYVASEKIVSDAVANSVTRSEVVFRSTDGGVTFGPGVTIAEVTEAAPNSVLDLEPGRAIRTAEFPTPALLRGTLWVAWNDGAAGSSHIRLAKSPDGGATWTSRFVTAGGGTDLQPALTADRRGLHLLYYHVNPDSSIDVRVSNSPTGEAFETRTVTSASFRGSLNLPQFDPIIAQAYMGDYIANATDGRNQYFAWGDNRDTVRNFLWPDGRNDPNVYFARQG